MEKILFLLLLVGLVVAKPSFDGDDDELIQTLINQKDVEDVQYQPEANLNLNDEDSDQDLSIFFKFIHYLIHVSVGKVKPDEHPDIKYIKPGKELVKRLLVVREAVRF
ncbi:uncharacterized protein LOC116301668 [Actinia tenebrosa]|uniref:Uncharacterized protein LOC116301668 n=1 Tax=Actinia tenebrosa TaxID=6105 RepID=A0A6P8IJI4_ACTTE|nr:uncharacterized protein LOC116301668 [Actinia tenebrosa]